MKPGRIALFFAAVIAALAIACALFPRDGITVADLMQKDGDGNEYVI